MLKFSLIPLIGFAALAGGPASAMPISNLPQATQTDVQNARVVCSAGGRCYRTGYRGYRAYRGGYPSYGSMGFGFGPSYGYGPGYGYGYPGYGYGYGGPGVGFSIGVGRGF